MDLVRLHLIAPDVIETVEQIVHPIVHLLQAHIILMRCVADKDLVMKHADRSSAADTPHEVMRGVIIGLDPLRHRSAGRPVDLPGPPHPQRFVRALLIEFLPKPIELALLPS